MGRMFRQKFYPQVPATYFGMHTLYQISPGDPYPSAISFKSLGKGAGVTWNYIEPNPGGTRTYTTLDAWFDLAEAQGTPFHFIFPSIPEWATSDAGSCVAGGTSTDVCSALPSDLNVLDDFVEELVARYVISHPTVEVMYEILNEPAEAGPTWTTANAITYINRLVPLIRANDSRQTTKIGVCSFHPRAFITAWPGVVMAGLTDAVKAQIDVITLHTYTAFSGVGVGTMPESVDVLFGGASVSSSGGVTSNGLQSIGPYLKTYGLDKKPVWSTEHSWGPEGTGTIIKDQHIQAAYLVRSMLLHWQAGFERVYWYAYPSGAGGTSSNFWGRIAAREAEAAWVSVYEWMLGAVLTSRMRPSGSVWSGNWSNPGVASSYRAHVAWDSKATEITGAASNGGLIRLTVRDASYFLTGDTVKVLGVGGTTEANGDWTCTVINATTIDLQSSTFTNTYTSLGSISIRTSYTVPSGMLFIRDIDGTSTATTGGSVVTITNKPRWFETHDTS